MRSRLEASSFLMGVLVAAGVVAGLYACAPASEAVGRQEHAANQGGDPSQDPEYQLFLAQYSLEIMGGAKGKCKGCHSIDKPTIERWAAALSGIEASCVKLDGLSPQQRLDCLKDNGDATAAFTSRRLGFYAAGVSLGALKPIFSAAFPADRVEAEHDAFVSRVKMPKNDATLEEWEFNILKSWSLLGVPRLADALEALEPQLCHPSTTPQLAEHIRAMQAGGWGARLAEQATPMYGCGASTNAKDCLSDHADVTASHGAPGVAQTMRSLRSQPLESNYWIRSSADGRYVAFGIFSNSKIYDLTKGPKAEPIVVAAPYDPYFLPSNDGFAFASTEAGGLRMCRQSLLADVANRPPVVEDGGVLPAITFAESKCTQIGDFVYHSIGTALDGSRYLATWGAHENDDGGNWQKTPLPASFPRSSSTTFTVMQNDGVAYRVSGSADVTLPFEGDMMLSASSQLAATRFGGDRPRGYRIRKTVATPAPNGDGGTSWSVAADAVAEVCVPGSKASFSFDERFLVTHQYVDPTEPSHAGLPAGSSNLAIVDLLTGREVRVTESKQGEFALYPHFRGDGWLYFLVRDMNTKEEHVIATDIALRLAEAR